MKKTTSTQNLKRYLGYTSSSHHKHIFKKKDLKGSITKEVSKVCTKHRNTLYSLQSRLESNRHEERNNILLT